MSLLPPKSPEKRPPVFCFRCPTALRQRIEKRAESTGWSASKIGETVADFGLTVWETLEPIWDKIDIVAKQQGESFPSACRRLIELGLAAYEKNRRGKK